jgi:hypothetical protein
MVWLGELRVSGAAKWVLDSSLEAAAEGNLADGAADDVSALLHGSLLPKKQEN